MRVGAVGDLRELTERRRRLHQERLTGEDAISVHEAAVDQAVPVDDEVDVVARIVGDG